jgi:hypothetical protein
MTWTPVKLIAATAVGSALLLGAGAGTAMALTSAHGTPVAAAAPVAPAKTAQPAAPAKTAAPAPAPSTSAPAAQAPAPAAGPTIIINNNPPAPGNTVYVPIPAYAPVYVTDNQAVVQQYYADLNSQDYQAAWALGGDNLNGSSGYDAWVAGYSTTSWITLGTWEYYPGSNAIQVTVTAGQSDGSVRTYQGTYTVINGVIVGASIVQTS